jgi:hypothetical protein
MSMLTGLTTIRLIPWHRWLCYAVWLLLCVTGVWWWWDQDLQMNDPTERASLLMKVHGMAAAVVLVLFGSLLSTHVRVAWQRKRNRVSGVLALLLMTVLGLTGLGLYYANEDTRAWVHQAHLWVGGVAVLLLPMHVLVGRFQRRQQTLGALLSKHLRR